MSDLSLRPYQAEDAIWMFRQKRCINASEMRVGKSPTTIQAIKYAFKATGGRRALIVCPASLKRNWRNELAMWFPSAPVTILEGSKSKRKLLLEHYDRVGGFLLTNFEQVAAGKEKTEGAEDKKKYKKVFTDELAILSKMSFTAMIVDEVHICRSRDTLIYKGADWLATQTPYLFLLTGTPIVNRVADLWTLLHMIDREKFSSYWKFVDHPVWGCGKEKNAYGGYTTGTASKNPEAFKKMLEPYLTRRLLADVLDDLPPLSTIKLWVDLAPAEQRVYSEMENEWITRLKGGQEIPAPVVISQLTRLRQFCLSPDLAVMPEKDFSKLGHGYNTVKFKTALELIQGTDQKVVVFSQFKQAISLLMEMCEKYRIGAVRFTGDESTTQRDFAVREFKCNPSVQVFGMVKQERIAVGLDLSVAPIVIHLDEAWTNATEDQATWRILGSNQRAKALFSYKILVANSIEQWLVSEKLAGKKSLVSEIVRQHEEFIEERKI